MTGRRHELGLLSPRVFAIALRAPGTAEGTTGAAHVESAPSAAAAGSLSLVLCGCSCVVAEGTTENAYSRVTCEDQG